MAVFLCVSDKLVHMTSLKSFAMLIIANQSLEKAIRVETAFCQ
jgi:hypothetical protein